MANTFKQLVASRREWIDNTLRPWCEAAKLHELRQAEQEWTDIAGRADPDTTLWTWAWQRFPELVHEGLPGVNETLQVRVTLNDGRSFIGFPDGRRSKRGWRFGGRCGLRTARQHRVGSLLCECRQQHR